MLAMAVGMGIGPIAGGVVADALNLPAVFYFSAGVQIIGIALFFMMTRDYRPGRLIASQEAPDMQPHD
jgi:predicted MFS family arabinose efflux permease